MFALIAKKYDPFSNLKGVSQRSISKLLGPVKNGVFLSLDIFQRNFQNTKTPA
jgi:hypothetical protein